MNYFEKGVDESQFQDMEGKKTVQRNLEEVTLPEEGEKY